MTKSKMIAVWGDENVLGSSINYFLSTKEDWKVFNITNLEDLNTLVQLAENSKSDIVFIDLGNCKDSTNVIMQLLRDHPKIRVIKISLENNAMEVYNKQKVMVKQASDLISVIENNFSTSESLTGLES